ncbi:hypothetical protein BH09ACT4_BH09ACT4_25880 [soil metagenome]
MKLSHDRGALALFVILTAGSFFLAGCAGTPPGDTASPSDDATGTDDTTGEAGPWNECPGIVERFNADENDPNAYEQVSAGDFTVQEVGADVLAGACVISIATGTETLMWAILPGDASLVETVKANLADAGFIASPNPKQTDMVGNPSTNQGLVVAALENGAALDTYLVYPTAFAPITESIVYMGAFKLS